MRPEPFDKLRTGSVEGPTVTGQQGGDAVGVVGGVAVHAEFAAELDVLRLVDRPDVHPVPAGVRAGDEVRVGADQDQVRTDDAYAVEEPAVRPPAELFLDQEGAVQPGQQPTEPLHGGSVEGDHPHGTARRVPAQRPQHLGQPQLDPRTAGIRVLGLDLQAHRDVVGAGLPHHLEELLQRDQLALRRSGLVHPSAAEVQALELRDGHLDRAAAGRGGAVDVQIVQADQLVVRAEVDVALQADRDLSLCAPGDRLGVRGPGHLGLATRESAMGHDHMTILTYFSANVRASVAYSAHLRGRYEAEESAETGALLLTTRPRTSITSPPTRIAATEEPSQLGAVNPIVPATAVQKSAQPGTVPG